MTDKCAFNKILAEFVRNLKKVKFYIPKSVAARCKAYVCCRSLVGIVGSVPAGAFSFVCRVLSGRGLCVGLISRPEEPYRVECVWVWSLSRDNKEALTHQGCRITKKWFILRKNLIGSVVLSKYMFLPKRLMVDTSHYFKKEILCSRHKYVDRVSEIAYSLKGSEFVLYSVY